MAFATDLGKYQSTIATIIGSAADVIAKPQETVVPVDPPPISSIKKDDCRTPYKNNKIEKSRTAIAKYREGLIITPFRGPHKQREKRVSRDLRRPSQ